MQKRKRSLQNVTRIQMIHADKCSTRVLSSRYAEPLHFYLRLI